MRRSPASNLITTLPLSAVVATFVIHANRVVSTVILALLRAFVRELEPGGGAPEGLRSLIAPETSPQEFSKTLAQAEALESACRGGGAVR